MKDLVISKETTERTVLVGLITQRQSETKVKEYLDELEFLADTAGATVVKRFTQKVENPNPRTFVGQGKLAEIKEFVEKNDIGMVIFDDDLSTKQIANIEKSSRLRFVDRSSLILDIFAKRAQTATAKNAGRSWRNTSICCHVLPACGPTLSASVAVSVCVARVRPRLRRTGVLSCADFAPETGTCRY